jgi:hypothetical protein
MGGFKIRTASFLFAVSIFCATCVTGCRSDTVDANAPWQPGTPLDKEKIVIGVIHVDDATSGYSLAHDTGLRETQKTLGLRDSQIIRKLNVNDADALMVESMMRECIEVGAKGSVLPDSEIPGGIDRYYRNVAELK